MKMSLWDDIIEFNDEYFPQWRKNRDIIFFSNALAGEVGEICNLVKKLYGGGTNNDLQFAVHEDKIKKETVDVYIYLVLLLEALNTDEKNFKKLFDDKMTINKNRMKRRAP